MSTPVEKPGNGEPAAQAQLLITVLANGSVQVAGPIENLHFCYGVLEMAKDAIREYNAKLTAGQRVLPVQFMPKLVR